MSAGVAPTGTTACSASRLRSASSFIALPASAASLSMMSCGVPAGARNITQDEDSIGGPPDSTMVGTSSAPGTRSFDSMHRALILPARTWDITPIGTSSSSWMLPETRSASAGAVPL